MKNWIKNMIFDIAFLGGGRSFRLTERRSGTGNGSGLDRAKSRITPFKPLLNPIFTLTFLFLVLGGFSTRAWGATVRFNANSADPVFAQDANPYYLTQDSVQFQLDIPNWVDNKPEHFYVKNKNDNAFIKWAPNSGFTIAVTGIAFNGCNTTYPYGWSTRTGSSWIKSYVNSSYNGNVKIQQNTATENHSFSTSDAPATNVFPSGNALGNNDYFNVFSRKKDSQTDQADGSDAEYEIYYITLTFTVTPPVPTLKNYSSSLTRYQYVEGRSNNTVTLTDYFKPFHEDDEDIEGDEVSMSYEVQKKDGGVYGTIVSGFDITDNVFSTTTVGEYKIRAKSNATGAFNASGWSEYINVSIEEVQPVTIVVGSRDLFVDETTTMTITEQLNETNPVVFVYDKNFFTYNSSTHVLTAKNIGNVSFTTTTKSIRVTQEGAGIYGDVDFEIPITIKKYANAITCSWGDEPWSKNLNFDEEAGVTFSSNNDTGTKIEVTPTSGSTIATYDEDNDKIIANFKDGTATWSVSQAEDYKYQAATTKTLTANVDVVESPNCITLHSSTPDATASSIGTIGWDKDSVAYQLQFKMKMNWAGYRLTLSRYINGSWTGNDTTISSGATKYEDGNKTVYLPAKTTKVKFGKYDSDDPYVNDIVITRRKYFDIKNAAGSAITSIAIPKRHISGSATSAKFYVHFSTCASKVKLESDNSHITFANGETSYEIDVDSLNSQEITLNYTSASAENITDAKVYIYTPYEHKTLTVSAQTKAKLDTRLVYVGEDEYNADLANKAATELFKVVDENNDTLATPTITLTSSATSVINVIDDTTIDFVSGGSSARITASYDGDSNYEAASSIDTLITVNKVDDEITWSGLVNDTLHVWVDDTIPYTIASAKNSNAKPITFTSTDASVFKVVAGAAIDTMTTLKIDTIRLTATTRADGVYNSVSSTKVVVVDPCIHRIVWSDDFAGLHPEEDGTINYTSDPMSAYAVDSTGEATGVTISYSLSPGTTIAVIDKDNKLHVTGVGETMVYATTAADDKYAVVKDSLLVRVLTWGENTAKIEGTQWKDNRKWRGSHAEFTFGGAYATSYGSGMLSIEGDDNEYYTITWSVDDNCTINVTGLACKVGRSWLGDGKIYVNNNDIGKLPGWNTNEVSINTLSLGNDDHIVFRASRDANIYWITITYTITANVAPTPTEGKSEVCVTVNPESPVLLNLTDLFSVADAPSDFTYVCDTIEGTEGNAHVHFTDGKTKFWADAIGDYIIKGRVAAASDHRSSAWSSTYKTIRVVRQPNTLRVGGVADYSGNMQLNSTLAGLTLTATNTDYVGSPISVEQIRGADTISYNQSTGQVTSSTVEGTGMWRISQAQSDKYLAAEATFTVNVVANDKTYSGGAIDWTDKDEVMVSADVTIDEPIEVYKLIIDGESTVTVTPTGGLTVGAGGIEGATKDNFVLQVSDDGGTKGQTAFLRISPDYTDDMPEVTMEMLRIGYSASYTQDNFNARGTMAWQYMGAPLGDDDLMVKNIVGGWINSWDETTGTWVNNKSTLEVTPFVGFANSQSKSADGAKTNYKGTIVDNSTQSVTLTKTGERDLSGWNLLANSFAAPIDIVRMFNDDDNSGDDVEQTVYLFNTGNVNAVAGDAGTYTPITKANAGQTIDKVDYQGVIPAMQGFFVKAKQNCTFTFNYAYAVWGATYSGNSANRPLRVSKREEVVDRQVLSIALEANGKRDKVLIIEEGGYSTDFENGYDAHIMPVGEFNIFAIEEEEEYLALDATNSIIGTKIGVRTGEEYAYTMRFSSVQVDEALTLLDKEEGKEIDIEEGTEYAFYATQNATITDRFEIVERAKSPAITTGTDGVGAEVKAQKFIKNNCLYIYKDGVLYNALGERVR